MRAFVRACVCACVCKDEKDEGVLVKGVEGGRCVGGVGGVEERVGGGDRVGECAARIFTLFSV